MIESIEKNNFGNYIDDDNMELLEYYCMNYDTDELDEMSSWLNKLGYNKEHINDIFNIEGLFLAFYDNYMKSIE